MKTILTLYVIVLSGILNICQRSERDDLFTGFVNPPAEARPFVRWWWNGNRITEEEIVRQLDVLRDAGAGGVEINPIEMPPEADTAGTKAQLWLSNEWNRLLATASFESAKRGMITDMIVGSGWPFGGEFLKEDEVIVRVMVNTFNYRGGEIVNESFSDLLSKALAAQSRAPEGETISEELFFARLIPDELNNLGDVIDLIQNTGGNPGLSFKVPEGRWHLIYGILEKGYRHVQNGAPGAAGPVMDHYSREVTLAYLNRLKKISEDTGIPLNKMIRALFCDSIELAGSNWTDGMDDKFYMKYGYSLDPFLPFIFYEPYSGYPSDNYSGVIKDRIKRVRYDFNEFMVTLFLDSFTRTFQEFCTTNGLLCRYQAYGTPFLMGLMEGNMIPDIPESNNWLFSGNNMDSEQWTWNQDHGYMIWNLYAASGGHLTGRKIISCEAMTNTRGLWKISLEDIKRHDDMNFITGMNHTVLHGYNYSPVKAGFPGWIRFGAYFSEQNTWWPYFKKWADYNSRLSYVFQQSKPEKSIAILGPTGDVWTEKGLSRVPFHNTPVYCYRLWEGLSQIGSSCDYIDENIIINGIKKDGRLNYGPMSYKLVVMCDVKSVKPATALSIREFSEAGGRIVVIGDAPSRSLSFQNADENDSVVNVVFTELREKGQIIAMAPPDDPNNLREYSKDLLNSASVEPDVMIADPSPDLFQIRKSYGDKKIFFFVNPNRKQSVSSVLKFTTGNLTPWIWDPEDGTRHVCPYNENMNEIRISLGPLESQLIIFEQNEGVHDQPAESSYDTLIVNTKWKAEFIHKNGISFSRQLNELVEFGTSEDEELSSFAGTVKYITEFESDGKGNLLVLPEVNRGVTEVYVNGSYAGLNWYGMPRFNISGLLKPGKNRIELKCTTILANYVRTLTDDPVAMRWAKDYSKLPSGLDGEVLILYNL
ncbi:MAG: hypothetical protein GYA41_01270 [Bacteroidales bacterium]|nr:hypothetical protein [Bacteroidales bacterium]